MSEEPKQDKAPEAPKPAEIHTSVTSSKESLTEKKLDTIRKIIEMQESGHQNADSNQASAPISPLLEKKEPAAEVPAKEAPKSDSSAGKSIFDKIRPNLRTIAIIVAITLVMFSAFKFAQMTSNAVSDAPDERNPEIEDILSSEISEEKDSASGATKETAASAENNTRTSEDGKINVAAPADIIGFIKENVFGRTYNSFKNALASQK